MTFMKNTINLIIIVLICVFVNGVHSANYTEALTKSLLFYEAQRSGKLPVNQRVTWRADSGLNDGKEAGVDLVGGYYDAGDNVKFGFPMAYTITMLSWSVLEYRDYFERKGELRNALSAIKWGTDYFIKAHPKPNLLYAQVGDGDTDHKCWQRPEDMTTPRTVYEIDELTPGSDIAGETAAAFAAASIVFRDTDPNYSDLLQKHAKELFDLASNHTGTYSYSIPSVANYYNSSGYEDELLWAAAWLCLATDDNNYLGYLSSASSTGGVRSMFSWDDKYAGLQILVTKRLSSRADTHEDGDVWSRYKSEGEQFLCNCLQKGNSNIFMTIGGLLWFSDWNNLQYTTSASFLLTVYADHLNDQMLSCPHYELNAGDLGNLARAQANYILGENLRKRSYMVGFGSNYPTKIHHRASSIVSKKESPTPIGCKQGYENWFYKDEPNPNVLVGAVVGGPDKLDTYVDDRENYKMAEVGLSNAPGLVGVLARFSDL